MRRVVSLALTIALCLTLSSCGGKPEELEETVLRARAKYIGAETIELIAAITANYGDRAYDFKLKYSASGGEGELEVLEPDIIAGIKARITSGGVRLIFDGATLDMGELYGDGLSAVDALPAMIAAWQTAYISSVYGEKLDDRDSVVAAMDTPSYGKSGKITQKLWIDMETLMPLKGEILSDGLAVIICIFESAVIK